MEGIINIFRVVQPWIIVNKILIRKIVIIRSRL